MAGLFLSNFVVSSWTTKKVDQFSW